MIPIREIVDLIKVLRPNLVWAKYDFVLDLINKIENKVEQVKLAQFFQQRYTAKCLYDIKYCVDGGQDVTLILTRMRKDGF